MKALITTVAFACVFALPDDSRGDTVTVAVASNFSRTMDVLVDRFQQQSGHAVRVSSGSSGKLYAQIINGAPFDVFFSADQSRPEKIVAAGLAADGSQFNYAQGQLVLWSGRKDYRGQDCLQVLELLQFDHLAIANPKTAPYGAAAQDWLTATGLWQQLQKKLVTGENIAQTFHFAASRNAALGLIAASQLARENAPAARCSYAVPVSSHRPILQQAVLLRRASNNPAAKGFVAFLRSEEASLIIRQHGYLLPIKEMTAQ